VDGVTSETDPQWEGSYRSVYVSPALQLPWYAILGNHDYHGEPEAEIKYSLRHLDDRWTMPDHLYNAIYSIPNSEETLEIIFIDTSILSIYETHETRPGGKHAVSPERRKQYLQDLEHYLSHSSARWLFVAGHYTLFSLGEHGDNADLIKDLFPLLQKYHVQVYMNGHDHVLQHMSWQGLETFTCGRGSFTHNYPEGSWFYDRDSLAKSGTRFGTVSVGFGTAVVGLDVAYFSFINQHGETLYTTLITNPRLPEERRRIQEKDEGNENLPITLVSCVCLGILLGCVGSYLAKQPETAEFLQTCVKKSKRDIEVDSKVLNGDGEQNNYIVKAVEMKVLESSGTNRAHNSGQQAVYAPMSTRDEDEEHTSIDGV
jgi:tartrate-resistant acid phosphatase type 5